ncbi:MAG: DUF5060 domain-containing protein, partial [Candidatus Ornithomonoglobus sp.]
MIRKWDMAEFEFHGFSDGNPFTDYEITGEFSCENETKTVQGFYDGDGVYRVRFMPSFEGRYRYRIYGNFSDTEHTGEFTVRGTGGHGMVRADGLHFRYSDGEPYYSVGTTCYAWLGQNEELRKQTLQTLSDGSFNKIRFCIFPKHYDYNYGDPVMFPYEGTPVDCSAVNKYTFKNYKADNRENNWNFSRFNTEYFRMLDGAVEDLMRLGIEADIILFHPYDRWGFSNMPRSADDLYLKYITARYGAYRNVWWSLANEYDLCDYKSSEDWEHYAKIVTENDPYGHLISIHNCGKLYDYSKSWITHCSIQRQAGELELDFIPSWLRKFNKPVVIDEMCYEGNIEQYWGSISGEEMLRRMWKVYVMGGYPGHSECYFGEKIWWSHGGRLYGESHKRFGFLHKIMTECGRVHN